VDHADAHTLLERLLRQIAPDADLAAADPEGPLTDELGIDSMDFLRLVAALWDDAGVDVPERDFPLVATVEGLIGYVVAATGGPGR
jgi:acyl carrier protein